MTIDTCYESIISKLQQDNEIMPISLHLRSLKTNQEKVLYVYENMERLKAFPKALVVEKCESVSVYYRNQGNKYFQKSKNFEAWQYYNLSLLHAPVKSDCYSLALANRSAVFFQLKKYSECLQDISYIISTYCPEIIKSKLHHRKTQCEKEIQKQTKTIGNEQDAQVSNLLTMKNPIHPIYKCASIKLEVAHTEDMGRHVIAKEDIKVGELLVKEKPYFNLLLKSVLLYYCSYCLSRSGNLLPCDGCCFALYCSENCKREAWKSYHIVECPLMATLIDLDFTKLALLGLRTVIKARTDHDNWEGLFNTIKLAESHMKTKYQGLVQEEGQWVFDSKYYTSIHTLETNVDKRSVSDIFQKAVKASVLLQLLKSETNFLIAENEEKHNEIVKCVAGLLLLHIMSSPTNMHNISSTIQNHNGHYIDTHNVASAPYPYLSLLNHSCAPNVVRYNDLISGQMLLIALRPIKKGMQLFDNYGFHHAVEDRASRQQSLKSQYKFMCLCEACINDWPTYLKMCFSLSFSNNLHITKELLDEKTLNMLKKGDSYTALNILEPLCRMAEMLEDSAPSSALADCQEAIKQCYGILIDLVPYGYNNLIEWQAKIHKK